MRAQAVIDSLEFARAGQSLSGSLPVSGFARLRDSLFDVGGEVRFSVKGGHDERQRPVLTLEITGLLHLQCQRCLGGLDYPLQLSGSVLLVSAGETAEGLAEGGDDDWIDAGPTLDLAELVEDEILLGLPYAPRHETGICRPGLDAQAERADASAFAKLAALKRNSN